MTSLDDGGTQSYNGLLMNVTYRKGNVSIAGNYTWSHCIGLPIQTLTNSNATYPHQPYQNNGPVNRNLDMGDCNAGAALDIRQMANITGVAKTPQFSSTWARRLGASWTFSTIYTRRTGYPVTPALGSDVAMNGFNASGTYSIPQRPNQVLADVNATNQGQSCSPAPCVSWFNPAAIASPTPGTYGNMGVGSLRAPGFWEWDQSISREFRIREGQRLEIRAEAFNVTNSLRLYIAPTNSSFASFSSGQFGKITSSASTTGSTSATGNGGRIMQLALKYTF
jgi:hypothetical protein